MSNETALVHVVRLRNLVVAIATVAIVAPFGRLQTGSVFGLELKGDDKKRVAGRPASTVEHDGLPVPVLRKGEAQSSRKGKGQCRKVEETMREVAPDEVRRLEGRRLPNRFLRKVRTSLGGSVDQGFILDERSSILRHWARDKGFGDVRFFFHREILEGRKERGQRPWTISVKIARQCRIDVFHEPERSRCSVLSCVMQSK